MYFERNRADYYGFVAKHIRIDRDNYSRTRESDARGCAREPQKIRWRNRADARFTERSYTVPYAKYRSESIKQRYSGIAYAKNLEEQM